jgi:hypothetical protein
MRYFRIHYADPSKLLSMERAREYDRVSEYDDDGVSPRQGLGSPRNGIESRRRNFDRNSYRQPVLTERVIEPLPYRRGKDDEMSVQARELLQRIRGLAAEEQVGRIRASSTGSSNAPGPDPIAANLNSQRPTAIIHAV